MSKATTGEAEVLRLRQNIQTQLRRRILEAIEAALEEELRKALGRGRQEPQSPSRRYRKGRQTHRITAAVGPEPGRKRGTAGHLPKLPEGDVGSPPHNEHTGESQPLRSSTLRLLLPEV